VIVVLSVTNTSPLAWTQNEFGLIRIGNHWLSASGSEMLIQDDARKALPEHVGPGESFRTSLIVKLPGEVGEYQLECDLVHEGITWFADRGSESLRSPIAVGDPLQREEPSGATDTPLENVRILADPSAPDPGPFPMFAINRKVIENFIRDHKGALIHCEPDDRGGSEWFGYKYFVRKL